MKKTVVVGSFDNPDTAHAAERSLLLSGLDQSALRMDIHEAIHGDCKGVQLALKDEVAAGLRNLLAELLGTEAPMGMVNGSDALRLGEFLLVVDVPDGAPAKPVCEALLDAGALDIHEAVYEWSAASSNS